MKAGDHIEKPWGWEQVLDLNDRYCIKHLFIAEGRRLSLQYHERKTETLVLVEGACELTLGRGPDARVVSMKLNEPWPIAPGTVHRMKGASPEGALIFEVSTPELEDVVRLEDDYGRQSA